MTNNVIWSLHCNIPKTINAIGLNWKQNLKYNINKMEQQWTRITKITIML